MLDGQDLGAPTGAAGPQTLAARDQAVRTSFGPVPRLADPVLTLQVNQYVSLLRPGEFSETNQLWSRTGFAAHVQRVAGGAGPGVWSTGPEWPPSMATGVGAADELVVLAVAADLPARLRFRSAAIAARTRRPGNVHPARRRPADARLDDLGAAARGPRTYRHGRGDGRPGLGYGSQPTHRCRAVRPSDACRFAWHPTTIWAAGRPRFDVSGRVVDL